jgi:hypothetical protein
LSRAAVSRPKVLSRIEEYGTGSQVITLHNPSEVADFLAQMKPADHPPANG